VTIDAQALLPSFGSYLLGGPAIAFDPAAMGLNLVQAAAPDGVNGELNVTVPTLDLGNALLRLPGQVVPTVTLGRGLCGTTKGSSLVFAGRGGVAATAYDLLWVDDEPSWLRADASTSAPSAADLVACR